MNIKKIMSDILGLKVEEINDETSMQTISSWDSLKHMELISAIEETFDLRLKTNEIVEMTSFKRISDVLKHYGS